MDFVCFKIITLLNLMNEIFILSLMIKNLYAISALSIYYNIYTYIMYRGRYPALGHPLPWAISFFFKWEENKYFSPYAYCFIFKSDLLNLNFVEKNPYFILFFLESYFFDKQSKFLDVRFYWKKRFNIDSFMNENWNKFKCHQSKVSRRKKKKVCC